MLRGKVRVAHGSDDALVPHQLLDCAKVNTPHHQTAGERVPQAVPSEVGHARALANLREELVWWLDRENVGRIGGAAEMPQGLLQNAVHLDVALLPVLTAGQRDDPTAKIDVLPLQPSVRAVSRDVLFRAAHP